ncbi:MAG: hypothetical protein JRJ39_07090, partial [Deltaproteobacteria bacterium]|nr:hypothetical protein [Deltaproteobacteria bacterium]
MKQIHLITPFMRSHLKDTLIAAYRSMNIVLHPIMFKDEMVEFDEPWILPLVIPMDSKECTVFMPGCFKRNWFIKNEEIIDGDYYVTADDDDMYEDGVFDAIKQMDDDIIIISLKRGYQIPANTVPIRQYPTWPLRAHPDWVKIGMISAQQSFVKGRIFKQHFHNEKSHNFDGELAVYHKEAGEQINYRPDLFALFNYYEPGRWVKNDRAIMRKVSIIIPVIREDSAKLCSKAIRENAGTPIDQYEIVSAIDSDGVGCPKMVKSLTENTEHDLVMFLGDDTEPEKDFLKHAIQSMDSLPDGWGVVGLNTQDDRVDNGNPIAHWLAHKKMLEYIPGGSFFSTEYKHCWCDDELKDIADELGRWVWCEKSRIKHNHPVNQTAEYDDGYQKAYSDDFQTHDFKIYCSRKRKRMKARYGTKLAVAIPLTDERIYREFFFSFVKVITEYMSSLVKAGKSISLDVLMPDFPCQIDHARNNLVHQALLTGCTHILMMDSDQIYNTTNMIDK